MGRLLRANFFRLGRDTVFYLTAAAVLASAVLVSWNAAMSANEMLAAGFAVAAEEVFFTHAPVMGLFYAVFVSLFLGTEYSDGTIRNKLVVGHNRRQVYGAGFLTCFAAGLVFTALWLLGSAPGLILVGPMDIRSFLLDVLIAVGFTAAFTAIFTGISMASSNKAVTIVLNLLCWLLLVLAASALYDRLCEPELCSGAVFTGHGIEIQDPEPNPLYLAGMTRSVCQCLLELLPTGQAMLLADAAVVSPARQLLLSVIVLAGATAIGFAVFRRKNLK